MSRMTLEKFAGITMRAFKDFETRVNTRLDDFESRVNVRFNDFETRINVRFNSIDARLDHHAGHYVTYPEHFRLAKRVAKLEKNKI